MKLLSQGCYELTGFEVDELIDNEVVSFGELIHPKDREGLEDEIQEAVENEDPFELEYRIETKSGEIKWVWERGRVVEFEGEEYLEGMITDINERKEQERELKRKERYLDHTPAFINVIDEKGEIRYHSYPFNEVTGLEPSKFMGAEAIDFAHPEDREDAMEMFSKVLESPGEEYSMELRGEVKDGWIWLEIRAVNYLDEPEINGIIVTAQDISKRKVVEESIEENKKKIEKLHEISAELQTYDSEDKVYSFAVKAAEEILDFDICAINTPEGDVMKEVAWSSGFPEDASLEDRPLYIDDSLAGKTYLDKRSFLIKHREENEHVNPTYDKINSGISVPIGNYAVFQAVSIEDEHFDEEDLRMAELLMSHVSEAVNRIKIKEREDFLHTLLRHDVANKNQIIKGYLELLKDHALPGEVKEYVEKAERAAKENIEMIEKIRNLRKIEVEKQIGEVDLSSVMNKVFSEHQDQLHEQGIKIDMDECDCKVKGGELLEELFSNLIENSVKHSDCDEIRVSIRVEGDEYLVIVEDDGSGIPDEVKQKIFEKGFSTGGGSGTGLGLYMVKKIAENYGGSIEVKDSEMGGARFDVRLKEA